MSFQRQKFTYSLNRSLSLSLSSSPSLRENSQQSERPCLPFNLRFLSLEIFDFTLVKRYRIEFITIQIHEANGQNLSRWLYWDDAASTLLGVPSKKDVGNHHLIVKAIGKHGDNAKDAFFVHVVPEKREEVKHKDGKVKLVCHSVCNLKR